MERTKSVESPIQKIRYKKIGGGSLRLNLSGVNKIIKQNETFSAYPNEIPKAFKDTCIPLDAAQETKVATAQKPIPAKVTFTMQVSTKKITIEKEGKKRQVAGYDVVDGMGKVINDKPLTKEVAERLINDLSK
jgi:hypothetical protein